MRKKAAILLFVFTALITILLLTTGHEGYYSDLCITEAQKQEIVASRKPATSSLYHRVMFNQYELAYDEPGNRLFYSLIEDSYDAYDPRIQLVSDVKGVQFAVVGEELTDEVIADGREFGILIYTDEEYQYVNLAFTTLPILSVDYDGTFRLFDNRKGATQRVWNASCWIRYRGRFTLNYPKKSYRMTLYADSVGENRREFNASLLGMRQDGDWILYAGYNDTDKVRNVFSSNLWKESCATNNGCGVDNGMEYKYVEFFLENQYWGLYALGYPIDPKQLQMVEGEYCYEKTDPLIPEPEIDFRGEAAVDAYEIREMGANSVESWEPLKEYYSAMFYAEDGYASLRNRVDIGNSIDMYLFLNLIQGVDHANIRGANSIFNLYLTNKILEDGSKEIMLYSPWDMDRTWGMGFEEVGAVEVTPDVNVLMQTNLVHLLSQQQDEELKGRVLQRYTELREGAWSDEHLLELLTEYEQQIFESGAYAREQRRWPEAYYSDANNKLKPFKDYVLERMKYMDLYIKQYMD